VTTGALITPAGTRGVQYENAARRVVRDSAGCPYLLQEVDILRCPGTPDEAELQREASLQQPPAFGHGVQSNEQPVEGNALAVAGELRTVTLRAGFRPGACRGSCAQVSWPAPRLRGLEHEWAEQELLDPPADERTIERLEVELATLVPALTALRARQNQIAAGMLDLISRAR